MKYALNIATTILTVAVLYFFVPLSWLDAINSWVHPPQFGSTITTILGTDTLSASRTTINTNFSNLNAGKAEIASNNNFSSLQNFQVASSTGLSAGYGYFGTTATSSFSNVGALTLATALLAASGGTGSSTLSAFHVLLGSTTNPIGIVSGVGTAGQALTSNGAGLPPTWQSAGFDATLNYTFTGQNIFSGTTTMSSTTIGTLNAGPIIATSTLKIGGLTYTWPSSQTASTFLKTNGSGTLSWATAVVGVVSTSTTVTLTAGAGTVTTQDVFCVSPLVITGGGFSGVPNSTANGNVWIEQYNGPVNSTTWRVTFYSAQAGSGNGTATVYALCANP